MASPWLTELEKKSFTTRRPDQNPDVIIVGGGISGIMTAYFLLHHTSKSVLILEAGKIAHGATGHNAGHVVSVFERSMADIVQEFGTSTALGTVHELEGSFDIVESLAKKARVPFTKTDEIELLTEESLLKNIDILMFDKKAGVRGSAIVVKDVPSVREKIPSLRQKECIFTKPSSFSKKIGTSDSRYVGFRYRRGGLVNSALLTQKILVALLDKFSDRCLVRESEAVETIDLSDHSVAITTKKCNYECTDVVLCTNGYSHFTVTSGKSPISADVQGLVGYMAGFEYAKKHTPLFEVGLPFARKTFLRSTATASYAYFSDRPWKKRASLAVVGGVERDLKKEKSYDAKEKVVSPIRESLESIMKDACPEKPAVRYAWHGLMGYSANGMRKVGRHPGHPRLVYNIGCNGVGIVPAVYSGQRIARIISGKKVKPSLFDILPA